MMSELSERELMLKVRGDTAIIALQAITKHLKPATAVCRNTQAQLEQLQSQDTSGRVTMLTVVLDVIKNLNQTTQSLGDLADQTLSEVTAFSEPLGISPQDVSDTILNAIRKTSVRYSKMSDEEIKQAVGL